MKLEQLSKISPEKYKDLTVGFSLIALATGIGAIANAIAPLIGLIKTSLAPQGEIKDKLVSYKWQLNDSKTKAPLETFSTFD
ncbi:hypothetical protein [Mycoplasmopsis gallopavonis]|uniref:Uncharacterized protein n=1 Tax=Mycoplasmopsis gallopavonis TaxID=76629 RepID=A0A449AZJ8_9BACT|nr:hypothetical protein [Mycoplasmopsis gallopavonis]RIV16794.1 hypothetical protein D1113_00945 [Mycoplasmopsis gallopavonis]VEU72917.1 Uncharacterised protein [Mycoplasmopsis gallopavonis]